MIEFIAFLASVILIGFLTTNNVLLRIRINELSKNVIQASLDKLEVLNKLSEELSKKDSTNIEQTEGFLRFVSQSRDWAFEYIEDAQERITKFNDELNNIINLGGNKKETVKLILEAYQPIKDLLPDEKGEK